jgi:Putative metal-binding motif
MEDPAVVPDAGGQRSRSKLRKTAAGAAVVALAFATSLALAEWLASGTGEGYARAGVAEPLTTESATAAASLYPGGTGDLVLRVNNPNPFAVTLTSVSSNGAITSNDPACDSAGHGVSFEGYTGSHSLPAESTTELTLADVLSMATTSADECQGATFTIPVSLNDGSGPTGQAWYADADADGFGDPSDTVVSSTAPSGFVADSTDCDDSSSAINPAATEVAGNGIDEDCDGEDLGFLSTWYLDADADTYGDPAAAVQAVDAPSGYVAQGGDCDDSDSGTNPAATEVVGDAKDNDCDGSVDE